MYQSIYEYNADRLRDVCQSYHNKKDMMNHFQLVNK